MVETLSTILLTSSELFDLRTNLKAGICIFYMMKGRRKERQKREDKEKEELRQNPVLKGEGKKYISPPSVRYLGEKL